MTGERIHRTKSADGTEIAGRVIGDGPPVVLVHGALFDGETAWTGVVPHLADRFTCFLPSTRGKGLSGSSTDCAVQRLVEDVTAFVDSIGEPVSVAGWSQGAMFTLGAAAQSEAVSAVAGYEPPVLEALDEDGFNRFTETVTRMGEYAGQGQMHEAARVFTELVTNEKEMEAIVSSGGLDLAAPNIPAELQLFSQMGQGEETSPTDPASLASISAPVLLLRGDETPWEWFDDGIRHVAAHVPDCEVRTIPGAGHAAPAVVPEAVAAEFVRFFEASPAPA